MRTRSETRDGWRRLVEQQQAGRLTIAAFCQRAGVSQPSFYAWRRRLRDEVSFAEVKLSAEPVAQVGGIELHLPGERWIVVRPGFDRRTLLELLAALESASGPNPVEADA